MSLGCYHRDMLGTALCHYMGVSLVEKKAKSPVDRRTQNKPCSLGQCIRYENIVSEVVAPAGILATRTQQVPLLPLK